jgi:hypothetical protein
MDKRALSERDIFTQVHNARPAQGRVGRGAGTGRCARTGGGETMKDLNTSALFSAERLQTIFWIVFILVTTVTGLFAFHFLPNEYYDPKIHDLLGSHQVCDDNTGRCGDMYDVWRDKKTRQVFTREEFAEHRQGEAIRLVPLMFVYGLIGCFAFGYFRRREAEHAFYKYLGMAVCVTVGVTALFFVLEFFR